MERALHRCMLLLRALALLMIASAVTAGAALTDEERRWIDEHPVLTVGNETDWPPFDFIDNGKPQGYAIDLIRIIGEKIGLDVELVTGDNWSALLRDLRNQRIDVLPAIYTSDNRSRYLEFSDTYFSQPSVIVVKHNNFRINSFADLSGRRVAGVRDFAITETLQRDYPGIELVLYDTVVDCLKAVSVGSADAYIDSIGLISFNLEKNFVPNLRIIGDVEEPALANPPLRMAVKKGNAILLSIINKGLQSVTAEERLFLKKKWLALDNYEKRLIVTSEQARWIRGHPTIRVGLDPDYPPYSFIDDNGQYAGIAVDMLALISQKTGLEFVPTPGLDWRGLLEGIRYKRLDLAAPLVQNARRNEYMVFSPPFISAPLVIMTRIDDTSIRVPGDLDNYKVALVDGYNSSERVLSDHPDIAPVWVKTPLQALQAVSTGRADAFIGVIGVNIYLSQQHGINNLQVAGSYDLDYDGQRFAIRSDWSQLAVLVTRALDAISAEQKAAIYDRWIKIPDSRKLDYTLLWQAIAVFACIVLALYWHNRRLHREIAQRRQAETELRKSNHSLEQARQFADQANRSKSLFVTALSHELKTPLNAVVGFSDLLRANPNLSDEDRNLIELIYDAGKHLNQLIGDMLDLSLIEAGKLPLQVQPTNISAALQESVELTGIAARKHNISIRLPADGACATPVMADSTRVKQIVLNLLSNAIKYNNDGGNVTIDCRRLESGYVEVAVTDSGVGMDATQLEEVFRLFRRAGAETSAIPGSGIGLALCRHLVTAMGGEIGARSEKHKGSTFWFTLRLADAPET